MENADVSLLVTVPICGLRKGFAREYLETERIPPPSTVYGFLLSLIGEEQRSVYLGTKVAYAILTKPEISVILRTVWRLKSPKNPSGIGNNRRPDYQEILTGLEFAIWIQQGGLADRLMIAGKSPKDIDRYGGLSLGESRDLVNDVIWYPKLPKQKGLWLIHDSEGNLPLPVWVDHVGSEGTIWQQFRLEESVLDKSFSPDDKRWITITNEVKK